MTHLTTPHPTAGIRKPGPTLFEKKEKSGPGQTLTHMHAPKLLLNTPLQTLHAGLFFNRRD
jgi:hypothetical protein